MSIPATSYQLRITLDLEVNAKHDPMFVSGDVLDAIKAADVVGKVVAAKYHVMSGQPISDTGLKVPRTGIMEVDD